MKIMQWFKKVSLDLADPDIGQLAFFLQMAVDGAKCDGSINENELNALHNFGSKMCGGSLEMSKAILEFIDSPKPPEEFKYRIHPEKWKTPEIKLSFLRDILSILLSDGLLNAKETEWLYRLKSAFGLSDEEFFVNVSFFVCREDGPADVLEWRDHLTPVVMGGDFDQMIVGDEKGIWRWFHQMFKGDAVVCPWCGKLSNLPAKEQFYFARCQMCQAYLGLTNSQGVARCTMLNHPLPAPEPRING